jgi:hypothetical protein
MKSHRDDSVSDLLLYNRQKRDELELSAQANLVSEDAMSWLRQRTRPLAVGRDQASYSPDAPQELARKSPSFPLACVKLAPSIDPYATGSRQRD